MWMIPIIAICDPACVYGACVNNNTCSCSNGYTGDICDSAGILSYICSVCILNVLVIGECEENICFNGGTCQVIAGNYLCACAVGFTGLSCNTSTIIVICNFVYIC